MSGKGIQMNIMNGDHMQFEIDHANTPKEERPDWPWPSFDAVDWAKAFNKRFPSVPLDEALPWMASALMRGHDEAESRLGAEVRRLRAGLALIATDKHRLMNVTARHTAASILEGKPIEAPSEAGGGE